MLHKFMLPSDPVGMTAEEAWRVRRVRIAKYYGGVKPSDVDDWSWADIYDTLMVIEADKEIAVIRAQMR